jgi:DNA-binding transcriptional ArsR family regulator
MSKAPVLTLDLLASPSAVAPDKIQEGFFLSLAQRIERTITGASRQPLHALSIKLNEAFDYSYTLADDETRKSLRDQIPGAILQAYRLGQLNYAQSVVSKAVDKRVSDQFLAEFKKDKYKDIIKALWHEELKCGALADATGESDENTSRKLKKLRELGITDFWREGTSIYNFLTPAAKSIVPEEYKVVAPVIAPQPAPMASELARRRSDLDQQYREAPNFARGFGKAVNHG